MSRRLFSVIAVLALCHPVAALAPVPFPRPKALAGTWTITFVNGVVETCEVRKDGAAHVVEPLRSSPGKAVFASGAAVITFDDGRVERWTVGGGGAKVEHWFPASSYPAGASIQGVARRAR